MFGAYVLGILPVFSNGGFYGSSDCNGTRCVLSRFVRGFFWYVFQHHRGGWCGHYDASRFRGREIRPPDCPVGVIAGEGVGKPAPFFYGR